MSALEPRAQRFWRLPDKELTKLLELAGQVDRLELKITIPAQAHKSTRAALGLIFPRTPVHRVYYLDTPTRALHRQGLILRVRRFGGSTDDSVVKLRPIVPRELSAGLRRRKDFVVEVDGMPGTYVCSGALKARRDPAVVRRVLTRHGSPRLLFTGPQLHLFSAHVANGVDLDDLTLFGPVQAYRQTLWPAGFTGRLLAERWVFPDSSEILELSTRCPPAEAMRVAARTATLLKRHGIDIDGPQQTKTRATLEFFTATVPRPRKGPDSPALGRGGGRRRASGRKGSG